ncbi:cytochrome P450 [Danaus plexippus plexippus]|uniref:unspecific monooxygenase n=1 Tax=Danaus plexippus plexippus TaxID=278856 RepID=A0A212EYB4_DANPL|nr:cytochrome P450 [Danaus plexippus plexippus]
MVKHDKPVPFLGNNARVYTMQMSVTQLSDEVYWRYPTERVVGFYRGLLPELVVRDPELVKRVLVTDFASFYPRGLNRHREVELLLRNLFFVDGDLWRLLRQRMTPAFTSGKLKAMFPLIEERAERLRSRALSASAKGRPVDARDLMARYTTDFIGACGFGLDSDSLQDENSAFRKLGAKIFDIPIKDVILSVLKEMFPSTFKNIRVMARVEKDLMALVNEVLRQRNHEPSGRNDFIDLMLECKKKGIITGDSIEKVNSNGSPEKASVEMTNELIAAQVFIFFAAGFETSSSATSTTLHELAYHPEVQKKVQNEIDTVLAKYNNKLCYEAIKEMTYLEWAFKEGMRIFPSLGFLIRQCAKPYTFEDLGLTIDEGVKIIIPLQALHNDPQYFDNPSEFRPERFDPQNFDSRNRFVYLPFGEGPRACIGERMGMMQSLAGLAAILSRFSVQPAPGAPRKPTIDTRSNIVQVIRGGLPLIFTERRPD